MDFEGDSQLDGIVSPETVLAGRQHRFGEEGGGQFNDAVALGQMAAGITHELNQPLAALRSFSDNTRVLIERGDHVAAHENLEAIAALTERMGKITNQLKLFVSKARPKSARTDVGRALSAAVTQWLRVKSVTKYRKGYPHD